MDYIYSFVANENPWITYTLDDDEYQALSLQDKYKCVHLPTLDQEMLYTLNLPNISELLLTSCSVEHIKEWNKVSSEGKIISTVIDGTKYYVEEHYPYHCFTGANIIAQLWRSRNPKSFNVHRKYIRMDEISPHQLNYLYGVYHFNLYHTLEAHSFVLYMTENNITVYNSYGGNVGFYITKYERESWLNFFINFWNLSIESQITNYHLLWGFSSEMVKFLWKPEILNNNDKIMFEILSYCKVY